MAARRAKTCQVTGLRLQPAQGQETFRVAKFSWGALNPPVRSDPSSTGRWGRYDVVNKRTAYSASTRRTAFAETLAYLSPSVGVQNTRLSQAFDDVDAMDPRTVLDAVVKEWNTLFSIEPTKVVFGWRDARHCYPIKMPETGWLVEIEHENSIRALNKRMSKQFAARGIGRLTRGHLSGEDRLLTTEIASWVRSQTLFDGSLPHGIVYPSKHGTNWNCYAVWLRRMDDGFDAAAEPTTAGSGVAIRPPAQDKDLAAVQEMLGLRIM